MLYFKMYKYCVSLAHIKIYMYLYMLYKYNKIVLLEIII